jgi:hypothetical protein
MKALRGTKAGLVLLALLAASPAIMPVYLILRFGIDVPYQDQCAPGVAGLFVKAHNGQLHLSDLFAQQNEHRIVVPRLIFLLLGWITHWNTICEMFAVWAIVCATSICVLWLIRRTRFPPSSLDIHPSPLLPWFLCNLLLFTPAASENWLWGMGVVSALPPAFLIAAMVVMTLRIGIWWKTMIAAGLCAAATYSSANGVLCWPLVGIVLLWSEKREKLKSKGWIMLAWLVAFVSCVALYAFGYQTPPGPPAGSAAQGVAIAAKVQYLLVFLGAPLAGEGIVTDSVTFATAFGAVMLALLCGMTWHSVRSRHRPGQTLIWLALGFFALSSGVVGSIFRSHLPIIQATSSRYCPYATCLPLALIGLAPMVLPGARRWRWASSGLGVLLVVLWIWSFPSWLEYAKWGRIFRANWKSAVMMARILPENTGLTSAAGADLERFRHDLLTLDDMGYIHPTLIRDKDISRIADEHLSAEGRLERYGPPSGAPDRIAVVGWAISPDHSRSADSVLLTYEDENRRQVIFALADIGGERNDVVAARGNRDILRCGWAAVFPISALPDYMRVIRITAWALDTQSGKAVRLEGSMTLQPPLP